MGTTTVKLTKLSLHSGQPNQLAELRRSQEVIDCLKGYADQVKNRCGDGYIVKTGPGKKRGHANVITADKEARIDNAYHNTLLKALGGVHD